MANVTEMPPPEAAEIQNSPVETEPAPPTPVPTSRKLPPGRPKAGSPPRPEPPFFERVASVPKSDWGTRAYMYVYADEPVCNPKTFGSTRYMLKSSVPILDLEGLKQDYGSFKGWMTLNLRKTGKDQTDEIDRFEFEIFDPKHPPKIPKSAWANDPRNKKWADLLPPEPPPQSQAAATFTDAIKVYKEIRDEVKQEVEPEAPVSDRTRDTLETIKLAKDLFAPSNGTATAPPAPADPFDTAKKIMDMRTNDPMITLLLSRMDAQDKAMEAARQREQELQLKLIEAKTAPAKESKGFIEQITELASVADKLEPLRKLFGGAKDAKDAAETVLTGRKMGTLEFLSDVLPKIFESPLANAAAHKIMQSTVQPNPGAAMQPPPPIERVPQPTGDPFQTFIGQVVTPKMLMFFEAGDSGEDLAGWIYEGFPEFFERLQNFSHPMMPGLVGATAILTAYKNTPNVWPRLAAKEAQFTAFVNQFCAWKPDQDDPPADPGVIDAEPEDLDGQIQGGVQ